jgi:hypothetical protein
VARGLATLLQAGKGKQCAGGGESRRSGSSKAQARHARRVDLQLRQQQDSLAAAVPTHPAGVAAGADGHDGSGCQPGGCLGQQALPVLWPLGPPAGLEKGGEKGQQTGFEGF